MSFTEPPEGEGDPREIAARLIANEPIFDALRIGEADIAIYMRMVPKLKGGKTELGSMHLPSWQGALAPFAAWMLSEMIGGFPDYLMILDHEFWLEADSFRREALVFHELMHAMQAVDKEGEPRFDPEGLPVWAIRPHDLEEFNEVAKRYGAWLPDVQDFMTAAKGRANE